jgi:hypothetical protein
MVAVLKAVEIISNTMTSRTSRRLFNDIFRQQGGEHAEKTMPLHFEFGAYQRYDYARRTARHNRTKFKLYGHRNPNVMKGDLRRIILASARSGIKATNRGWTVKMRGTQKHRMWAQSRIELEQISNQEMEQYGQTNIRRYTRLAGTSNYRERSRRVIRK